MRHILDARPRTTTSSRLSRYARIARGTGEDAIDRKLIPLQRRAKGPYNPAARMRAFLRIERGIEA